MANQYLNLLDMLDGGGAGRAGDTFQGGGILSALGNAAFRPAGYQNRMAQNNALLDKKNSTGRAITSAVQGITGGAVSSSPRPQARPYTPQNLPAEVPMGAPLQDANRELVGMDADAVAFDQFVNDIRLKEQVYGFPPMPLSEIEMMYEEYKLLRLEQEMGGGGVGYGTMTSPTLPAQAPAMPMPGY